MIVTRTVAGPNTRLVFGRSCTALLSPTQSCITFRPIPSTSSSAQTFSTSTAAKALPEKGSSSASGGEHSKSASQPKEKSDAAKESEMDEARDTKEAQGEGQPQDAKYGTGTPKSNVKTDQK